MERTPKFADYVLGYLDFISSGQGTKKPGTIQKEKSILARWSDYLGQLRTRLCVSTSPQRGS
ncbi:MAG: hypothetical protein WDM76_18285 [Limisphaerales bacterium]